MTDGEVKVSQGEKTNVVYIVLDDMGFADLGCFGSEVQTPNIDRLGENGLRYSNFTVCPASSPTRASLLTGRDHHAVGMGNVSNVVLGPERPNIQGRITPEAATVAEVLRENGYATLGVGKWHVAPIYHATPAGPFDYWPLAKGFERYYGFLDGECDQYTPFLIEDNHMVDPPGSEGYHLSVDLVDRAIKYVADQVSVYPDKPFFLNLAFGVAHSPHQVPKEYIEMYRGAYDKGWDVVRQERYQRQLEMGILPEGTQLSPKDPAVQDWESMDDEHRRLYSRFQETYAGFITHCDEQIGRFIDYLEAVGELDNTMIYLIADNGASRDGGREGVDDFIRTMNGCTPSFEDLFARIDDIGGTEMKALYPKGWAHASNTPFREYKGTNYGGGTRTPLVVHWPAGIQGKGKVCPSYIDVTDITPTVLNLLDIPLPEVVKGVKQMPLHGFSFSRTFTDAVACTGRSVKFHQWVNSRAINVDGWKAISIHTPGRSFDEDRWQLFNLKEDLSESVDLAAEYPQKLQELIATWWDEAAKYGVLPLVEMKPSDQGYIPADSSSARRSFKLLPGMGHMGWMSDPPVENRSHAVTVPISRESRDMDGVLVACGDNMGGYTLYVKDDHLVYEYNRFGARCRIESDRAVPLGDCTVRYEFKKTGYCVGEGSLYIDDALVGEAEVESVPFSLSQEGTDVGRDALLPVSKHYGDRPGFAFAGTIHHVRFDVEDLSEAEGDGSVVGGPLG
ncbi:MAG: arylsulfatase [Thermoleophilia bacterium]|nr:arylsulfatase [Thermoleophilia bacterium]